MPGLLVVGEWDSMLGLRIVSIYCLHTQVGTSVVMPSLLGMLTIHQLSQFVSDHIPFLLAHPLLQIGPVTIDLIVLLPLVQV